MAARGMRGCPSAHVGGPPMTDTNEDIPEFLRRKPADDSAPADGKYDPSTLEPHQFALRFPAMTGEDFDELVEDIKKNGQLEPIHLYEGKVLDGRNRLAACLKL